MAGHMGVISRKKRGIFKVSFFSVNFCKIVVLENIYTPLPMEGDWKLQGGRGGILIATFF